MFVREWCVVACVLVSLILPAVDLFIETAASSVISGVDVGQPFIPPHYLFKASSLPQSLHIPFECTVFSDTLELKTFSRPNVLAQTMYTCF